MLEEAVEVLAEEVETAGLEIILEEVGMQQVVVVVAVEEEREEEEKVGVGEETVAGKIPALEPTKQKTQN